MAIDLLDDFVALSAALTGFRPAELLGTGMARAHHDTVRAVVGDELLARLCATGRAALAWDGDVDRELAARVLDDRDLGPIARSVIVLWYVGQWDQLDAGWRDRHGASPADQTGIVSAEAYTEGLVWPAVGAHPQGAKPTGYGSWALPPPSLRRHHHQPADQTDG